MESEFEIIKNQQEYFEPKSAFKSNYLKGLVNLSRDNWILTSINSDYNKSPEFIKGGFFYVKYGKNKDNQPIWKKGSA